MNNTAVQEQTAASLWTRPVETARPRVGFAGLGWIGKSRMEAIARTGLVEISAIADPDPKSLALCDYQNCSKYNGIEAMLQQDLDAVVIATPTGLHKAHTLAALNRGMAVFCQKPLGLCAADVRQMTETAKRQNRLLGVDLSYRHVSGARDIRRRIADGEIGPVYAVDLVFHNAYGPDKEWYYDFASSGGGCVADLGIHLVDLALWTLNWPGIEAVSGRVFKRGRRLKPPIDQVEDFASARLDTADGAVINLTCSWNLSAGCDAVIKAGFYGRKGSLRLENVNGSFYEFRAVQCFGTNRHLLEHPADQWYGRAAAVWAQKLARSGVYDSEIEQMITVTDVLDRIYERHI